ncbi:MULTISPECIES: hypothetical protein [Clostridium]|uniref:Uncharacterized protein n=4 Tax=Clostridium novyi TaxID=1542 RepID=A0Q086_CLONN|nr:MULTISPECIES: hypothetical protein [Clostridium]KEH85480.1 hypothetical protein Z966_06870 [Clostridium novyi A str. NCTC 538]KEH89011.1 hypothetical protein Z967_12195 [Clostridium novyi A str. 4540]ABK61745.1 hypothetical protein NT01CX_1965 [Clostridium novyi NT]KEH92809.1 hypothetical protein Z963_04760 [Clostridium botulinum C/D str. It1]KEH93415.1 hypothetical protein Z964_03495 [Clostridium novyi A str. GD211209]
MSKKFRNNLILFCMIFMLIGTFFICYKQKKLLNKSKSNLYIMTSSKMKNLKNKNYDIKYEKIIGKIKENPCIKIKKAINNNDSKMFSMNLEFIGTLEQLEKFIDGIKKSHNLYEMESIKLTAYDHKLYKGYIVLNITI